MENPTARWLVGLLGAAMVCAAVLIRSDQLPAGALLLGGVALLLAVLFGPQVRSVELSSDKLRVETYDIEERDTSAELADETVDLDSYEAAIESDDQTPPGPSKADSMVIGGLNLAAGEIALRAIFEQATRSLPLLGCNLRLYLFDSDEGVLVPAMSDGVDSRWPPGVGATGTAFETRRYVLAVGAEAWDDTFGLDPDQQDRYRSLEAVAAMPVFNAGGDVIAVVTAHTADPNTQLPNDDGEVAMVEVALLVSRVLVELLKWFDDRR